MQVQFIIFAVIATVVGSSVANTLSNLNLPTVPIPVGTYTTGLNYQKNIQAVREAESLTYGKILKYLQKGAETPVAEADGVDTFQNDVYQKYNEANEAYLNEILAVSPESQAEVSTSKPRLLDGFAVWAKNTNDAIDHARKPNDPTFLTVIDTYKTKMDNGFNAWFTEATRLITVVLDERYGGSNLFSSILEQLRGLLQQAFTHATQHNTQIIEALKVLHEHVSDTTANKETKYTTRSNTIQQLRERSSAAHTSIINNLYSLLETIKNLPRTPKLQKITSILGL